jgi:hypothetical protein
VCLLLSRCATGYEARARGDGLEPDVLACARKIQIGEPGYVGMPHLPRDEKTVAKIAKAIRRDLPEVVLVKNPQDADFIISVLLVSSPTCSHCEVGPEVEWEAIVERGGAAHRKEYRSVAPFIELHGRVREGSNAARGFVRQLRGLIRASPCRTAG